MMRATALALALLVPSIAMAQEPVARPSYDMSNVMHVVAAITGMLGAATTIVAGKAALDCSDPHAPCSAEPASWIALVGLVVEVVSLVLGISATELHSQTRRELAQQSLAMTPSLSIEPGGLSLRW